MTKRPKKRKAAPTYEEIMDHINWIIGVHDNGGDVSLSELIDLREMFAERERTRWKPSD